MFNFNKNEQEKFNKKMNNVLEDLEKISYVEALARIAAFNKQSKTFEIKICSKKESRLENVIKNAGIMAASILAKNHRDRLMDKADKKWPQYGFSHHKGYPTKEHYEALGKLYIWCKYTG